MLRLSVDEIIKRIQSGELFEAEVLDGGFAIKINSYVPYCCTAIHDGSSLRPELQQKIRLGDYERWYEEDPNTGDFISALPITLVGRDSRFEYDLNRSPESCIYEEAWGKKVWKKKLSPKQRNTSLEKHKNYYRVTEALIHKLESKFGACIVYDLHSYNYKRWDREVPVFNIGTEKVDNERFGKIIGHWKEQLSAIGMPDIEHEAKVNDVFYGRGYNLAFITERFKNTLVLATEVKKIYCNELTGSYYPKIIKLLQQKMKKAILSNANFFSQAHTNWKHDHVAKLLDKKTDLALNRADKGLYKLLKNFELLAPVNPINAITEQKHFFKNKASVEPQFIYRPIKFNPFQLKQELHNLPVQHIQDVTIRHLYESVVNSFFDKIDLLESRGTSKFLYNSLRYFGQPSQKDLHNAKYIMRLPDLPGEAKSSPMVDVKAAMRLFKEGMQAYGFDSKVEINKRVISQIMINNAKRTVLFRPDARFTPTEIRGLFEHEIGVHMVTTMNADQQKLKVFNLGLPVNTKTQEGLAILAEYLSGNLSLKRLKKIAIRVLLVNMMIEGASFSESYAFVRAHYKCSQSEAFNMVTRVFRGGGFTKDYLYLSGFTQMLRFWEKGNNLDPLLIGKTSFGFINTINEMIQREMIQAPKFLTQSFNEPNQMEHAQIYEYIFKGLK